MMRAGVLLGALAGASTGVALVARRALLVPLSEDLPDPSLLAARPPALVFLLAAALGALLGGAAGTWLDRRGQSSILYPLLLPGLAGLSFLPGALTLAPFLAAFSGTVLDLVLFGCLVATAWRAADLFGRFPLPSPNQVALAAFSLYLVAGYRLQNQVGLSGDEPHYLVLVQSLLRDGDLQVANNYERGDAQEFYTGKIRPHLAQPGRGGALYSIHGVGLPLLLLPGFALFGLRGVLFTEALVGALAVRETFRATEALTGSRGASLFAAAGFGATVPALFLSTSAYPELPASLVAAASFRRLLSNSPPQPIPTLGWGLLFGLLPFLHIKFIPLGVFLALAMMMRWQRGRWLVAGGLALGLIALATFSAWLFGDPNPAAAYGRQRIFASGIPLGLAGLLFDQESGLLPASPIYFFALAGLGGLLRHRPFEGLVALTAFLAVALPGAAHPLWSGGTSPPARFLFPALPLIAVAGGTAWSWQPRRGVTTWARTLLLLSCLVGAYMAFGPGQPLYLNQRDGSGRVWEALGTSRDLTHYLPSLSKYDRRSMALAGAGACLLVGAILAQASSRPLRLPPAALAILACAWMLDLCSAGRAAAGSGPRWRAALLKQIPERLEDLYAQLPEGRLLKREEAARLIVLPLESASPDRDSAFSWESAPFFLPAGKYRLSGGPPDNLLLCNGEGCFSEARPGSSFITRLALTRFHVRSETGSPTLNLAALAVGGPSPHAESSLRLGPDSLLHFLDEHVFLEPEGFWVKASSRASLAVEAERAGRTAWSLSNRAPDNWIEVAYQRGGFRFRLEPGETRRFEIPLAAGLHFLAIACSSGLRPGEVEAGQTDRRPLGVFVAAAQL